MSWREQATAILRNAPTMEPNKPNKPLQTQGEGIYSVFEVPPPPISIDSEMEQRHIKAMESLEANPDQAYSLYSEERKTYYLVTVGIRDRGSVEIRIPRHRMDAARMVEILDRHNLH